MSRPNNTSELTAEEYLSIADRLAKYVATAGECEVWTGFKNPLGYGVMTFRGQRFLTHRAAYLLARGQLTPGLVLDHLCRNPACCKPDHLEEVSNAENMRRGFSPPAISFRTDRCFRGHEFTPENTAQKTRGRQCRTCLRIAGIRATKRYREKLRRLRAEAA